MKNFILMLLTLSFLATSVVLAEDQPAAKGMDPEMATKMAEAMKFNAPGENHKRLDVFVGKWNYTGTMKMKPDAEPMPLTGTSESKWILDGRFLQTESTGPSMMPGSSQEFHGMGLMGFNNMKQEYESVWLDSMSTSMVKAMAKFDAATNTINETGTFSCPISGKTDEAYRAVWTIKDADHYSYEMYGKDDSGQEFKNMEISYERAV